MPLNYLDRGADIWGIQNAGQSLNNAAMTLARDRMQREAMARNAAIEGAYLQMAQQKAAQQAQLFPQQLQMGQMDIANAQRQQAAQEAVARLAAQRRLGPQGIMPIVQDPQSGPMLINDLRSVGAMPQGATQFTRDQLMQAVNAALAGRMTGQAFTQPAAAERMVEPIPQAEGVRYVDPFDLNNVLSPAPPKTVAPLTPEEQRLNDARIQEQQSLSAYHRAAAERAARPAAAKPLTPQQAIAQRIAAGGQGGGIPQPKTQADYDAIPSGTEYIDTDGLRKRKK